MIYLCADCGNKKEFVAEVIGHCSFQGEVLIVDGEEEDIQYSEYFDHSWKDNGILRVKCGKCFSTEIEDFDSEETMLDWLEKNPEILKLITTKNI